MTQTSPRKNNRRWQRRGFALLNPIMRTVIRMPWAKPVQERLLLLTYTGRKTGKQHTVPVSYAQDADGSLLIPGGGAWKWNLGGGREVDVRLRGHERHATSEVIGDTNEVARLMPVLTAHNPRAESFIGVPMRDGEPDAASLNQAVNDGFRIVRLRLMPGR